ncbi:histidinol-phosphatase (PHP family) [Caloramator quimbayensis]|uniref:Histidinol-phosphatase n=1 Tax=Caloramator quimbayensis TaxID=1147123 RepID=A0A1T4Y7Z7_9CLOT|nr:histidinol-phosphatase HisJ family protein [Caloramator quimbayensis]SKA97937.1 histidinol-phosphatase (PHP family) [Caloramator quimbayensis]
MITIEIIDYHIHSNFSFDGKNEIKDIIEKAVELGLSEICFTEHFCIDPEDVSYNFLNYNEYSNQILKLKESYKGKIKIKKGLEIGEPCVFKEELNNIISNMDLDFMIGSIHNINHKKLRLYIENKQKDEIYHTYFLYIYDMVRNGNIDVIGHLDLMKRYAFLQFGNYSFKDFEDLIYNILKCAIERNIGIEINTSGLRDKVNEIYPSIDIIKLYYNLGGEIITIGSDSHSCDDLAKNYLDIIELLKNIGFKYIFKYEKRKPLGILIK